MQMNVEKSAAENSILLEPAAALFDRLHPVVRDNIAELHAPYPAYIIFASFTNGATRAKTVTATGQTVQVAWDRLRNAVMQVTADGEEQLRWMRIDWVDKAEIQNWAGLKKSLTQIKRNYFRCGLSLDAGFTQAFLETELNANAMLYGGPKFVSAVINEANFLRYAKIRHGLGTVDFSDESPVYLFSTRGAFAASDEDGISLTGEAGRHAGRREIGQLNEKDVTGLIDRGSLFLSAQVQENGRFIYGWHPCFDREIRAYNSLRHASTLYSMIEAWEVTRQQNLRQAIDRALDYLTGTLIKTVMHQGRELAFLVDHPGEIKLGGNAVCLLTLVKYCEVTGTDQYYDLLEKLAAGMLFMQDAETGKFSHVLHYPSLEVKEAFRIIYYDGEAAFGLMRLYSATRDARWLAAVEKAFTYFIAAEHWRAHDHWLSYAVNELTLYHPRPEYFTFGIQNFTGYLDFVSERITTFPTLLELMMAAQKMVVRMQADPALVPLLSEIDLNVFYAALEKRAHYLLNGHFWPELAMFYARPERITGSFFIRHHAFRVRIDDVEHYLSGFVAYRKYLLENAAKAGTQAEMTRTANETDVVGFLSYPLSPKGFREIELLAEKAFRNGLRAVYASYKDCVVTGGKINGYAFDGAHWHKAVFSVPPVIDNAPPRSQSEAALYDRLAQTAFLTCHKLGGKQVTLDLLAENPLSRAFLIPYQILNVETATQALAQNGQAIIKPLRGNRGRGVSRLRLGTDGIVTVSDNHSELQLGHDAFENFITERSDERWMLQNYIASVDQNGRAFDIRVPVMRGGSGCWEIARSYVRLGAGAITSNLATGGSALDVVPFLRDIYGEEQAQQLLRKLEDAAVTIAEALQAHYPFMIDALGCDFGIADGKICLFEVNSYPGIKGCLDAATGIKADFYRLLLTIRAVEPELPAGNNRNWLARVSEQKSLDHIAQKPVCSSRLPVRDASRLTDYFKGEWLNAPPENWQPLRMMTSIKRAKAGDIVPILSLKESVKIGSSRRRVRELGLPSGIGLLTDRDVLDLGDETTPVLKVPSVELAVKGWVSDLRRDYKGIVFAVSGSVGKSTTTRMLSSVLRKRGRCLVSVFNNLMPGIYRTACRLNSQSYAVFEVAQGSLPEAAIVLRPDVAILLSASPAHMERHLTLENLVRCKAQIFEGAKEGAVAVINRDMPHYDIAEQCAVDNNRRIITFGYHEQADFRLTGFDLHGFAFEYNGVEFECALPSPGAHIAMNSLAVLAGLCGAGMDWHSFIRDIKNTGAPPKGRGNAERVHIDGKDVTFIDQAYNANPESVAAAISMLRQWPVKQGARRILVLADMLELGADEETYHAALADRLNAEKPDLLILAGELVRAILRGLTEPENIVYVRQITGLFPMLAGMLQDGDVVMFKGSNGTGLQNALRQFMAFLPVSAVQSAQ